jgi:hypothetical protein
MATNVGQRILNFRWLFGGLGILGVTAVLSVFVGPVSVAVGAGLLVLHYWSSVVAFAVGHVAVLLVPQLVVPALPLLAAEACLACLLVESASRTSEPWRTALTMGVSFAVLAAIVVVGWMSFEAAWGIGVILVVIVGIAAYGLHRYERLVLGLTETA